MIVIEYRERRLVNTDPQRRCYNGYHYSSELILTPWKVLEYDLKVEEVKERLEFWKRLNDIAVKARGPSAMSEFRGVRQ